MAQLIRQTVKLDKLEGNQTLDLKHKTFSKKSEPSEWSTHALMSLKEQGQWVDYCEEYKKCENAAVNRTHAKQHKNDFGSFQHYVIMTDYDKPDSKATTQSVDKCSSDSEVTQACLFSILISLFLL